MRRRTWAVLEAMGLLVALTVAVAAGGAGAADERAVTTADFYNKTRGWDCPAGAGRATSARSP